MKLFTSFLLVFLIFGLAVGISFCVNEGGEAYPAVEGADNALKQAFAAVLEAERAGANVSSLIAELNEAGGLLAEAQIAYRTGNFNEALSKANQCSVLADGIMSDALSLKGSALADVQRAVMQALTFSMVGGLAFLTVILVVWRWFRRAYAGKLLQMKTEVASDVED